MKTTVSTRVSEEMLERIEAMCAEYGITKSECLAAAIEEYFSIPVTLNFAPIHLPPDGGTIA